MLKSTHLTAAAVSIVVTASTPLMIAWGLDAEVAAEIAAGLGCLTSIVMTLACVVIGKYTALAEPAAILIAAVESDMAGETGIAKKDEAVSRLKAWLDSHISNPITRMALKFMASKAIEGIVQGAKQILYTPSPKLAKKS